MTDIKNMSMRTLHEKIGFIPQSAFLFSGTVADNLRMGKPDATEEEMWEALETAQAADFVRAMPDGLDSELSQNGKNLSGGQRQRVAIGRAIVRNPQVFLMDEPLSNLDAKLRNQMRAEIIKLRQRIDTTFIYVTHDQTEAMTLGDRIVIMKDGYIQQIGTPQEVFEHPANIFVAGFIGTPQMNLFDAKLVKTGGGYQVEVCGAMMPLSEKIQQGLADKGAETRPVTLGIRPEHIHLQNGAGEHTISAKVDVSEMMGSEIHLHVNAGGKDVVLRIPTTELAEEQRGGMGYGTELHFTFREDLVHLFDPETGKNLL